MKPRRLLCFSLALLLFICGAYSALPCGHVAAAEATTFEVIDVYTPSGIVKVMKTNYVNGSYLLGCPDQSLIDQCTIFDSSMMPFVFNDLCSIELSSDLRDVYFVGDNVRYSSPRYFNPGYLLVNFDTNVVAFLRSSTSSSTYSSSKAPYFVSNLLSYDPPCPNTDANCDNICDECGELLPMEYWSTALEYLITAGYNLIDPSSDLGDQSPLDYFCILYNYKDKAPELIVGETEFEINTSGDVLLTHNPQLYKLFEWENGSFSHYNCDDVSHTSDGLYLDPNRYVIDNSLRVLYSNHSINNRFVYNFDYDPFGGGSTVGGGSDREQATRFDIDVDTYDPIGGLPADPEYGSGRVDVVVSPSAPPVSVPISPTSPVPTSDPSDPVVTPSPDPSEPNSIIIQNQITNIGENIAALPEKLGDKIAGAIKGLFVPSESDFIAIRLKWNLLLEERFGAVYESTAIIDSIVDTFEYSGDMSSIKFPAVTVDLAGTPFTFGGWDVEVIPEGFMFLVSSVKLIVSIVCTVLFVNAMRKKLEGLINR